ncbi:molybdenum cofactor synthesis domain-containing protein [Haloferacaceae archaeon DSL9]
MSDHDTGSDRRDEDHHHSDRDNGDRDGHDHRDGDRRDTDHRDGDQRGHDHRDGDDHARDHHHGHDIDSLGVAVVTVSSSRSLDDDPAGDVLESSLSEAGHEIVTRELLRDNFDGVQSAVNRMIHRDDVDVVVTTGGTGVTPDDVTIEAIRPLFDKELPGFGELFRRLSYDEIGTRAVGTRSLAGVANGAVVFCLPGSENAARLGVEALIVPEAGHLAGLAVRTEDEEE